MKQFLYLSWWFFKAKFFGVKRPLQTVLFISNKCNLSCKHCTVYDHENPIVKSYAQVKEELEYSYHLGSRFVDLEGGEPFLWTDGDHDLNSLVDLAKEIGYFSVTITTNATKPFQTRADSLWISLDGLGKYHNQVRGEGVFEKLEKNMANCGHKALNVNMVINKNNAENVLETIEYAKNSPYIKMISLNFHTPYPGTESLFLDWESRAKLIDQIIQFKKQGYPIMNSVSGLKLMKNNKFKKECWVTNFILPDGTKLKECAGSQVPVCDSCGLCMAGEMKSIFRLSPDTIISALKMRFQH